MRQRIAVIYNEPVPSRYDAAGEAGAIQGVLKAVAAVRQSLQALGYEVSLLALRPPLERALHLLNLHYIDLVFNLFEGFGGQPETEARLARHLEATGVPFTGCPTAALQLGLDKAEVKVLLLAAGIATPEFQLLNPETLPTFHLNYPCIVKPRREDASHGISEASVVRDFASLERQVRRVSEVYGAALVETFVAGREFNATVLGDAPPTVLPVSEITYNLPPGMPEILTFASKWEPASPYYRGTRVVCPAQIGDQERALITDTAAAAFRQLGGQGYGRVDMRLDEAGRLYVIEVNPNPDISPDAGAARQARAAGMDYTHFIKKIVQLALGKERDDRQDSPYGKKRQALHHGHTAPYARVQNF